MLYRTKVEFKTCKSSFSVLPSIPHMPFYNYPLKNIGVKHQSKSSAIFAIQNSSHNCSVICVTTVTAMLYIYIYIYIYLIQNSQAVKKCETLKKAMVKKDVKSKVAAKKWL